MVYLEYEIPILVKIDDLWSYKTIFKHFKQKGMLKKISLLVKIKSQTSEFSVCLVNFQKMPRNFVQLHFRAALRRYVVANM